MHDSMDGGGRAKQDARAEELSDPDIFSETTCNSFTMYGNICETSCSHNIDRGLSV